jgi:hypothetical protein
MVYWFRFISASKKTSILGGILEITMDKYEVLKRSRRHFMKCLLPVPALLCGGYDVLVAGAEDNGDYMSPEQKASQDSQMTFKEVFKFAYEDFYIPMMKSLQHQVGEIKFLDMLKDAITEVQTENGIEWAKRAEKNDFASYIRYLKEPDRQWVHTCTHNIIAETERTIAVNYTWCMWADVFRAAGASEIGFAAFCHGDFAICKAFNPKIRLYRSKTLMQGDDYCDHRYEFLG